MNQVDTVDFANWRKKFDLGLITDADVIIESEALRRVQGRRRLGPPPNCDLALVLLLDLSPRAKRRTKPDFVQDVRAGGCLAARSGALGTAPWGQWLVV